VGFIRQQCQLTAELSKSLDRNLLDKAKEAKEAGLARLNELAKGTENDVIKAAIKQLDKLSETFAQTRMGQSIKSAFSGKSVDRI
jgi:molecular chaperone HscA